MLRLIPAVILALLVVPLAGAAGGTPTAADRLLERPAREIEASLALEDKPEIQANAEDALANGAYRWALLLMAESVANERTASLWAMARTTPEPYANYSSQLGGWAAEEAAKMLEVATRLAVVELSSRLNAPNVESLLFAAQYLVLAESSLLLGARLVASTDAMPESHDTPQKRFVIGYPLAQAAVFTAMADRIVDHFLPQKTGRTLNADALSSAIAQQGGTGLLWVTNEAGLMHRLARHLSMYEVGLLEPGTSQASVQARIDQLTGPHLQGLLERGFSGARARAVAQDASWWLAQDAASEALSTGQADMLNRIDASVALAQYEADLFVAIMPEASDEGTPAWLWTVAGVAAGGIALGAVLVSRSRRRGHESPELLPALAACLLVVALFALPYAEGRPTPSAPVPTPIVISADQGISWGGSAVSASNGTIHLAWAECLDPGEACPSARLVVRYRTFDANSGQFSAPATIVSVQGSDAYLPQLVEEGAGLALVWQQGFQSWSRSESTSEPAEVWWCRLVDQSCTDPERVSTAAAGVESFDASVGPDGFLRIAWAELGALDLGEVVFRQRSAAGWSPEIRFPDGGADQWQPAVAVDASNVAHVAWPARHPEVRGAAYHVAFHATVQSGSNLASPSREASQHMMGTEGLALVSRGAQVHLVYGTSEGLYHRTLQNGKWANATLASPTGEVDEAGKTLKRPVYRPDVVATQSGIAAVWMERVYPASGFRLRMAEIMDGMWLRPTTVIDPPHSALFNPVLEADANGLIHVVWSGSSSPDGSAGRMQYMTVNLRGVQGQAAAPPQVTIVAPLDKSWTRHAAVNFSVELSLDAPLDAGSTRWTVSGSPVTFTSEANRLVSTMLPVSEGLHEIELTLVDTAGNRQVNRWSFGVDRTAPVLQWNAVRGDGSPAYGWTNAPVRATAASPQDQGAPSITELQAVDGSGDLVYLVGRPWAPIPAQGLELPADILLDLTARARDAAGNVALGQPLFVGWDSTPPSINVTEPQAWQGAAVGIDLELNGIEGSPVRVQATLTGEGQAHPKTASIKELSARIRLTMPQVADGRYVLQLNGSDEAGNPASLPGPWTIGVDSTPPVLTVEKTGDGVRVVADDWGSGVTRLVASKGTRTLAEQTGSGEQSLALTLADSKDLVGAKVVAVDRVGNELRGVLRGEGSYTVDVLAATDGEADLGSHEKRGSPSLGATLTVLCLGLMALQRRRRLQGRE